jgi:hypothetical protein
MADPATSTSIAIATSVVTVTGSLFGLSYDALLAGLAGGLIAQTFVPPNVGRLRAVMQLVCGAILAGYFTPVIIAVTTQYATWKISESASRLAAACFIGMTAFVIVPMAQKIATGFMELIERIRFGGGRDRE